MAEIKKVAGAAIGLDLIVNPFNTKKLNEKLAKIEKDVARGARSWKAFGDSMNRAERIQNSFFARARSGWERGIVTGALRGEGAMGRLSIATGLVGQAFEQVRNDSQKAALRFQGLQRRGSFLQAGLGVLAGTLGDITGGFLSLVGVVGQAAGSMYAIVGAISTFVAGGIVAKFALGGVGQAVSQLWRGQEQYNKALVDAKRNLRDLRFAAEEAALSEEEAAINLEKARETLARVQDLPPDNRVRREAELAFKQAELNYRKVKAAGEDARADAKRGNIASTQTDPFKNLTASQKVFAQYLLTTKSAITDLKESAAGAFLPGLQKAIEGFIKNVFPTLNAGFKDVGDGLGIFVNKLSDAFQTPENLKSLREFFANSKTNLDLFGTAVANGLGAFLTLLVNIQPLTEKFADWLSKYFGRLDEYFKSDEFDRFVSKSMEVAGLVGGIFRDVFGGISNIMKAAFPDDGKGGGYILLDWIKGITEGFKEFTGSKDFQKWLADSTRNATTALGTIGQILKIFVELAGSVETFQFWTIIREAIEPLKAILKAGMMAGPAFAKFLVSFTKFIAIFLDNPQMMISFFETLTKIVDTFDAMLRPMKPLFDAISGVHGVFLAIGVTFATISMVGRIFFGTLSLIFGSLEKLTASFNRTKASMKRFAVQNFELIAGFKSGIASQKAFITSLNQSLGITSKVTAGIKNLSSSLMSGLSGALTAVKNKTVGIGTSMSNTLGKGMDNIRVRALMMANSVEQAAGRAVKAFTKWQRRGFMPKVPVESRRQRNRAMMESMATDQGMTRSPVYDKRIPILQRIENTKTSMLAKAEQLRTNITKAAALKRMQITRSIIRTGMAIEKSIAAQSIKARTALEAKGFYDYTKAIVPRYMAFAKNVAKATGFNIRYYASVAKDAVRTNVGRVLTSVGNSFTNFGRKVSTIPTAVGLGWLNMTQKVNAGFQSLGRNMLKTALRAELGFNKLKTSIFVTAVTTEIKLNKALNNLKARLVAFRADNTFEQLRGKIFAAAVVAELKFNKAINSIKANLVTMRDNGVAAFQQLGRNMIRTAIRADLQFRKLKTTIWTTAATTEIRFNRALRNVQARFATLRTNGVASLKTLRTSMLRLAIATDVKARKAVTNLTTNLKTMGASALTAIKALPATTATAVKTMATKIQSGFTSLFNPMAKRLSTAGSTLSTALSNASANAARASRLSWAASLNATEKEMADLSKAMDGLTAKEIRRSAAVNAFLPGYGGFKGTMGRFGAKAGSPLMMAGMMGSMMGPQAETPGVGSGMMTAGMLAMMIPGWGTVIGGVTMLAGAITNAFEAKSQADKAEKDRKREASYQFYIKQAEINAENVSETGSGIATLVSKYNKSFTEASKIFTEFQTIAGSKVWDPEKAFAALAPYLTGKNAGDVAEVAARAISALRTTGAYTDESATGQVAEILESGYAGKKGLDALKTFLSKFYEGGELGAIETDENGNVIVKGGKQAGQARRDKVVQDLYRNLANSYRSQSDNFKKFAASLEKNADTAGKIALDNPKMLELLEKNVKGFSRDNTGSFTYKGAESKGATIGGILALKAALQEYMGSTQFASLSGKASTLDDLAAGKVAPTGGGTGNKGFTPQALMNVLNENKRKSDPAYLTQLKQLTEAQLQNLYLDGLVKLTKDRKADVSLDREALIKALTAQQSVVEYMPYNNPSLWMPGATG